LAEVKMERQRVRATTISSLS